MEKSSSSLIFKKIISDIKSVKIQGAENVCKAGIQAYLLYPNEASASKILETRPTEPLLQNAIKILQKTSSPKRVAKSFLLNLEKAHKRISREGAILIKKNMNVYVHCHSSTVMDILKYAHNVKKKKFIVYTTEVEPLLQGHRTAKDLAKSNIKTIIAPDMAAEEILSKCDIFLFGADAFTKDEVANKIGTATLSKLAKIHGIPTYTCGVSLKFTKKIKIQRRSTEEVWDIHKKNIEVQNIPFDKTKLRNLTGIISEFGILKQKEFIKKAKKKLLKLSSLK